MRPRDDVRDARDLVGHGGGGERETSAKLTTLWARGWLWFSVVVNGGQRGGWELTCSLPALPHLNPAWNRHSRDVINATHDASNIPAEKVHSHAGTRC